MENGSLETLNGVIEKIERETLREEFSQMTTAGRKYCWYVVELNTREFQPVLVVENHPTYFVLDYKWGKSRVLAEKCVSDQNKRIGVTDREAAEIVASSMVAGRRKEG